MRSSLEQVRAPGSQCQSQISLTYDAGSGIGRQLSLAYVRAGIQGITLADLSKDGITETARMILEEFPDAKVLPVVVDVTDEASVNATVDQAVQEFGTLDCGETIRHPFPRGN